MHIFSFHTTSFEEPGSIEQSMNHDLSDHGLLQKKQNINPPIYIYTNNIGICKLSGTPTHNNQSGWGEAVAESSQHACIRGLKGAEEGRVDRHLGGSDQ